MPVRAADKQAPAQYIRYVLVVYSCNIQHWYWPVIETISSLDFITSFSFIFSKIYSISAGSSFQLRGQTESDPHGGNAEGPHGASTFQVS